MTIKLFTIIPIVIALASCSTSGIRMSRTAEQQSLSSGALSERVQTKIALTETQQKGSCRSPIIHRVVLQSSARGGSGSIIAAREDWIINRCGRDVVYQVDYYGPLGEATNIHVKQITR